MSRRMTIAAATITVAALLISGLLVVANDRAAWAASGARGRAFIVLAPYLTWDDVLKGPMPATRKLAEDGMVADMNVRSGATGAGAPTLTKGALLLSAGASVLADAKALPPLARGESLDGAGAADLYRSVFGRTPGDAAVLFAGAPRQELANERSTAVTRLGALGGAVRRAGGLTVAIGTSDPGVSAPSDALSRPAGIVASDERGLVDLGDVSAALLTTDVAAPFGVRTDRGRLEAAIASAGRATAGGPALVVIDPGDLSRAYDWASLATTPTAAARRTEAVTATDRAVAAVMRQVGPNDVVAVIPLVVPEVPDLPSAFAPLIIHGAGLRGLAVTSSTHRTGVCTIMDVARTLLDAIGATAPPEMIGSPISGTGAGAPLEARAALLTAMNDTAVAVEAVRANAVNWFITGSVIVLLGSALLLFRGAPNVPAIVWRGARLALLLLPCVLVGGMLQFALWRWPASPAAVVITLVVAAVGVWAGALALARGREPQLPLAVVTGLTAATLLVDQWLGAPLSYASVFGYAPLFGARYYGIGNEMAGLLLGSAMTCVALVLDTWRDAAWVPVLRRWGWVVLGAVVTLTAAAPFFGANVGAVAWMTVGFTVAWLMLNGRRVWTWRNAILLVVVIALVVAGLSVVDLVGGAGKSTHLGRAVSAAGGEGGLASIAALVARKAETNLRVLGRTNWTWLLVAVLLLLGYMRWRPRGEFAAMLRRHPAFSAVLGAALFAGIVGNFTEDSGVIIPALIMLPVGVTALYLMLDGSKRRPGEAT